MEALLYAEVYLICLITACLLLWWMQRREVSSTPQIWLRNILIVFAVNFLSNFLFTVFNRIVITDGALILSYLFKSLYLISLCVGVYTWIGYAESILRNNILEIRSVRKRLMLPLVLLIVLIVINIWTGWVFRFDETLTYRRGWMFAAILPILTAVSAGSAYRLIKRSRGEADPTQVSFLRLTASFPLSILLAWGLSFLGERVPVICVCICLELMCLYIGTTNYEVSLDKLTQVNNRQNLIGYLNNKIKNHEEDLYLLMIDLYRFKQINDRYGHLEGDNALVTAASAIKYACGLYNKKRPFIARYGGDEFIVVIDGTEEDVLGLIDGIRSRADELQSGVPYRIVFSIGYAAYTEGMDQKALIAAADAELYRVKELQGRGLL